MNPLDINDYYERFPFKPVTNEYSHFQLIVIEGRIPEDLNGTYFRNGPNPFYAPYGKYHWFDGDGMIHAISFQEGVARYTNKWVQTRKLQIDKKQGSAQYGGFREKPRKQNLIDYYFKGLPIFPDVSNTDIVFFNKKLFSVCAPMGEIYQMNPHDLSTIKREDFRGRLKNLVAAHSKVDPQTGEFIFYGFNTPIVFKSSAKIYCGVISKDESQFHSVSIPIDGPKNMHDFAITRNYTILLDQPLEISAKGLKFNRSKPSRYGFIPRYGNVRDVIWIETPADYIIHTVNAYEVDAHTVVLIAMDVVDVGTTPEDKPFKLHPLLTQWTFDLKNKKLIQKKVLHDEPGDFAVVNEEHFLTKKNRYTYMPRIQRETDVYVLDALVKYDHSGKKIITYKFGENVFGNEFTFVAKQNSTAEDDGYLIGFVTDISKPQSYFLILNGLDLSVLARLELPQRIPSGFHGTWIPNFQSETE